MLRVVSWEIGCSVGKPPNGNLRNFSAKKTQIFFFSLLGEGSSSQFGRRFVVPVSEMVNGARDEVVGSGQGPIK